MARYKSRKRITRKTNRRKWNKGAKQNKRNKVKTMRGGYRL